VLKKEKVEAVTRGTHLSEGASFSDLLGVPRGQYAEKWG
jgi:hypothetical protein